MNCTDSLNLEKEIELCACIIKQKGQRNIILISMYLGFLRRDATLRKLLETINAIKKEFPYAQTLYAGETNMDVLKVNDLDYVYNFTSELESCMLLPKILQPTRVNSSKQGESFSCIDNFYVNDHIEMEGKILISSISVILLFVVRILAAVS